ncbi:MAG TPA: hypothetical protein VKG38_12860, partial [Solirubrobacteraceae bacterium]|nr:hypothetical protein [Solirubrobacteraceae bacterium]
EGKSGEAAACLPAGAEESGPWSASITGTGETKETKTVESEGEYKNGTKSEKVKVKGSVPILVAGSHQQQVEATIHYAVPLCEGEAIKPVYRTETETESPKLPCKGEPDTPVAEPGYLCVYTGGSQGSLESEWKNAKFFGILDLTGLENGTKTGSLGGNNDGALVVFRTTEFNAAVPITSLKESANLNAIGSWTVRAAG